MELTFSSEDKAVIIEALNSLQRNNKVSRPDLLHDLIRSIENSGKMFFPTELEDIDLIIMHLLNDSTLFSLCSANKYLASLCRNESFWYSRIRGRWPFEGNLNDYKPEDLSFKEIYKSLAKSDDYPELTAIELGLYPLVRSLWVKRRKLFGHSDATVKRLKDLGRAIKKSPQYADMISYLKDHSTSAEIEVILKNIDYYSLAEQGEGELILFYFNVMLDKFGGLVTCKIPMNIVNVLERTDPEYAWQIFTIMVDEECNHMYSYIGSSLSNKEKIRYFFDKYPEQYYNIMRKYFIRSDRVPFKELLGALLEGRDPVDLRKLLLVNSLRKALRIVKSYHKIRKEIDPTWTFSEDDFLFASEKFGDSLLKYMRELTERDRKD